MLKIYASKGHGGFEPTPDLIQVKYFNDGTPNITIDFQSMLVLKDISITWIFDAGRWEKDLFALQCIMDEMKASGGGKNFLPVYLYMPYIPNARMDRRTLDSGRVFTLKTFARLVNDMGFDGIYVLDPHSDVSLALIERCKVDESIPGILHRVERILPEGAVPLWVFPDAGAMHRYRDDMHSDDMIFGEKVRDPMNDHITGYALYGGEKVEGRHVIVVDDIIAHGYTMLFLLQEIWKHNPASVKVFATHIEDSFKDGKLFDALNKGELKAEIYTTPSIKRSWSADTVNFPFDDKI